MYDEIETNRIMKKEWLIGTAGVIFLAIVFVLQFDVLQQSSPLALLIIVLAGYTASLKFKLVGGTLLSFSGVALFIHPFMFSSSYWLLPGALLVSIAGSLMLLNWWKQNGNQ